jgi:hypothetical protein
MTHRRIPLNCGQRLLEISGYANQLPGEPSDDHP